MNQHLFYLVVSGRHQDGIIVEMRDLFFYCNKLLTKDERIGIQVVAIESNMIELITHLKIPRYRKAA